MYYQVLEQCPDSGLVYAIPASRTGQRGWEPPLDNRFVQVLLSKIPLVAGATYSFKPRDFSKRLFGKNYFVRGVLDYDRPFGPIESR